MISDTSSERAVDTADERKSERARLKKAVGKLGWKLARNSTVEIKIEREFHFGPRVAVVRGRVALPVPDPLTAQEAERLIAPLVEPVAATFRHAMERAAPKILSGADDVPKRHVFEHQSFFSALEEARRGLLRAYTDLENQRVDERVEADLGLHFYIQSFTRERREFAYFVGPTNSGKTHAAIELLRAAQSGVYLAPLRLLALEVHERLEALGVPASLVTGEERIVQPGAQHVSSTVEMVDLGRRVEVAVVDEAQMLQDEQRGWAWTLAIAGVRAKTVLMCGSEDGLHAAQKLATRLGSTLAVRRFERKNPLRVVDAVALGDLRRGDAVVAFTRNAVVALQAQIAKAGHTTAAIYGSLSPAVRRREAERFRAGSADVLVATDAIGLGLNLPIRRLIFAAVEKYDGVTTRMLRPAEVRQIAGRAGRYGLHEEGLVSALERRDVAIVRAALERFEPRAHDEPIWISPTDDHLRRLGAIVGTTRVSRLLQFFQTRVLRGDASDVRIADLAGPIDVATALETSDRFLDLPFEVRSAYSRAPVTTRGNSLAILTRWGDQHAALGIVDGSELTTHLATRDRLLLYEDRSRLATLYLWLAQRFPNVYVNAAAVVRERERIDDDIHAALRAQGGGTKPVRKAEQQPVRKGPRPFNKRRLPKTKR